MNCRERCERTEQTSLEPCFDASPEGKAGGAPERDLCPRAAELPGWCSDGLEQRYCVEIAQCMMEVFDGPGVLGTGEVLVAATVAPWRAGECEGPDGIGPCRPDSAPCSGVQRLATNPERAATTTCADDDRRVRQGSKLLDLDWLSVGQVRVRLEGWEETTPWQTLDGGLSETTRFPSVMPGATQAVIELHGEYPTSSSEPHLLPEGGQGLTGSFCWTLRGQTEHVPPDKSRVIEVLAPHSSAVALARAWAEADRRIARAPGPARLYMCESSAEACRNDWDDDGDGREDCEDDECAAFCDELERGLETCSNGLDDDGDDLIDCQDPGCGGTCEAKPSACRNHSDDDLDGRMDCDDPDCEAWCPPPDPEHGSSGSFDESQCDAFAGCETTLCAWICGYEPKALCHNELDDDGDGLVDCADPDCAAESGDDGCAEGDSISCADGLDNDGDNLVDCEDVVCPEDAGLDNLGRCREPTCAAFCSESSLELCADEIDNDGDGASDCHDVTCPALVAGDVVDCRALTCADFCPESP